MKKIACILFGVATIISCGNPNTKEEPSTPTEKIDVNQAEEVWEEFEIRATGNTMQDMAFSMKNITVKEGSWVRIRLINEGSDPAMIHNIVFVNYGTRKDLALKAVEAGPEYDFVPQDDNVIAASPMAGPGETVLLEFKAPEKNNYEFFCSYPGHANMMRGYFFVK